MERTGIIFISVFVILALVFLFVLLRIYKSMNDPKNITEVKPPFQPVTLQQTETKEDWNDGAGTYVDDRLIAVLNRIEFDLDSMKSSLRIISIPIIISLSIIVIVAILAILSLIFKL